jgi:L-fucono-1,5-lactonase
MDEPRIIDAHQHFIRFRPEEYPWIDTGMEPLRQDHLPDELDRICRSEGVAATIAVEARQSFAETDWLLGIARRNPLVAGVVGWVDLRDPRVEEMLDRYAGEPLLKGVRHVLHDEADERFMLSSEFGRGIAALGRRGLAYDLLIFARHLTNTLELVRRFPEQRFVIDHLAKPPIASGEIASWRELLRPVAACPNVFCKLSGMVTEARPGRWKSGALAPYIETVLELFGPARTMFGSDWPVCTLEASYAEVISIVKGAISPLSAPERAMILGETAARFYHLDMG